LRLLHTWQAILDLFLGAGAGAPASAAPSRFDTVFLSGAADCSGDEGDILTGTEAKGSVSDGMVQVVEVE